MVAEADAKDCVKLGLPTIENLARRGAGFRLRTPMESASRVSLSSSRSSGTTMFFQLSFGTGALLVVVHGVRAELGDDVSFCASALGR
jgi:hypothetical protein